MMLWLLSAAGWLRKAASAAIGLVIAYPWQCALAASLALAWWQHSGKVDAIEQRDKIAAVLKTERKAMEAERGEWRRQVQQARAAAEKARRDGMEAAKDADQTYKRLASDNRGLRDFIARNRVLPKAAAPATPAGSGDGPGVPADSAADTLVATTVRDLEVCDDLYAYAFGAYEWTLDLRAKGLAVPAFGDVR